MPYLSQLSINVTRNKTIDGKKLHVYLSRDALVDADGTFITQGGYIRDDLLNTLLAFPELGTKETDFTFTYLHPGSYCLTVIADMDGDGYPSPGDVTHAQRRLVLKPSSKQNVSITDMNVKN